MMRYELTVDDASKLKRAYEDLSKLMDLIEETNRKYDKPHKPSCFLVDAHRCLSEVLYGEYSIV